jgi:hypothetical protein
VPQVGVVLRGFELAQANKQEPQNTQKVAENKNYFVLRGVVYTVIWKNR